MVYIIYKRTIMDDRLLHNREADDSTTAEDLESELASNAIGSTLYNKQWVLGNW